MPSREFHLEYLHDGGGVYTVTCPYCGTSTQVVGLASAVAYGTDHTDTHHPAP